MSPVPRAALIEAVASSMSAMTRGYQQTAPEPWLHLDITLPQLKALMLIDSLGPMRPSTIAESIGVTATGVTGLLDRLEERAFVRREPDPSDRRATVVRLESAGRALLGQISSVRRGQVVEVLEHMSDEALRTLQRGLDALLAAQSALREETAAVSTNVRAS